MTIVDVGATKTTASVSCAHCCVCTELYSHMISCSTSYLQQHSLDYFRSQEPTEGLGWVKRCHQPGPKKLQDARLLEMTTFHHDPHGQLARRGGSHQRAVQGTWDRLAT